MDIFKFNNPENPTKMQQGEIINNIRSKLWIERYNISGEFELVAKVSTGLRDKLPIGSFISHLDTREIMIVENHEISDDREKEPDIKVTGQGLESFFKQRATFHWNPVQVIAELPGGGSTSVPALPPSEQAAYLIKSQITTGFVNDTNDAIPFLEVIANVFESSPIETRYFKIEELYAAITKFLDSFDLGIKIIRPGFWSPLVAGSPNTAILIHKGVDKSEEIVFSYDTGEIETADYLWSNKKLKNAAVINGKWLQTCIFPTEAGIERRWIIVDASDIDGQFASYDEAIVYATEMDFNMKLRGYEVLNAQKDVALTKAEVSKNANKAGYRTDFDVGDIITVTGNYSETTTKRISEYVEIEDEEGQRSYPTLTDV